MMENEPSNNRAFGWPFWLLIAVVLLLAAFIIVPNFVRYRIPSHGRSCIANLKQIDGAVQQWALVNNKLATDTYTLRDSALLMFLKGSTLPVCPQGGRYLCGTKVSDVPRCTIPGHTL